MYIKCYYHLRTNSKALQRLKDDGVARGALARSLLHRFKTVSACGLARSLLMNLSKSSIRNGPSIQNSLVSLCGSSPG